MKVLVIAEHNNSVIKDATLNSIMAANIIAKDVELLVLGSNCEQVIENAKKITGLTKVISCDDPTYKNPLAENFSALILEIAQNYTHILAPATTFGKNILPRVAALLDMSQITDVIEILNENSFKRPIYAGNIIATVQSEDKIKILTIRSTAFAKAKIDNNQNIPQEKLTAKIANNLVEFVTSKESGGTGPELTSAKIVISGGRGLGSAENFSLLKKIADKLGNCAIGASRAAVDAGYVPNDYQVGQTGKIVAPELYIAVGISGAIQHLAGMKDSKIIVAINKDENAPIFEIADYGLVGDLFTILPEFEKLI